MVKRKFGKHQKASKHYDQNCRTFQHVQYVQISPILSISSMWKYEIFFVLLFTIVLLLKNVVCVCYHTLLLKKCYKRGSSWLNCSLRLGTYWMKNDHKFVFEKVFLEPSRPNPGRREKIKLNFYFHISLWCLKRFYKGLKGLHKTFWGITKTCENKNLT